MKCPADWVVPDWPAPARVRGFVTARGGGVSAGPHASFNIGEHCGDDPRSVAENRRRLAVLLPAPPRWLHQVHGSRVVAAELVGDGVEVDADASWTCTPGVVCAVKIADCVPVLLCDRQGTVVAAAHAGWRGLAAGVLENTVAAMGCAPADILAFLGPAIGPDAFEVGGEVRAAFMAVDRDAAAGFRPLGGDKWLADLYALGRQRLARAGVTAVHGGGLCTHGDAARFFSYRRERDSGRMAAVIWLAPAPRA